MVENEKTNKKPSFDTEQFSPEFPPAEYTEIPNYKEGISYKFDQLPEKIQQRLLKLHNEDGEHLKFEYRPKLFQVEKIIAIIAIFLAISFPVLNGRLSKYFLILLIFPLIYLVVSYLVKRYEIKTSPINPLYIITPTQLIETNYGSVKFWGLHKINQIYTKITASEKSKLYIFLNGSEKSLVEKKKYKVEPSEMSEGKVLAAFDKLKLWCEEYKEKLEAENFNPIIAENIFYELPILKGSPAPRIPRFRFNLLTQIFLSTFVTLLVVFGLDGIRNKYKEYSKEKQFNNELQKRNTIYDKKISQANEKLKVTADPKFTEYVIAILENAKLNNNPKVYLLIEGENTISATLEKRLQEKLGNRKLIKLPKNIAEGTYDAGFIDKEVSDSVYRIFAGVFTNKELIHEKLESRHRKIDLSKESLITIKYKLEMSDEIPAKFFELKDANANPQKTKIYYPDLVTSIEAIFDVPNKPQQSFKLNTKPSYQLRPIGLDGTIFYGRCLSDYFGAAMRDLQARFKSSL